jgi:hypothetical protein
MTLSIDAGAQASEGKEVSVRAYNKSEGCEKFW